MSAVVGSQYGATTVAAKSLISQLHPQGKLTTQKRKNWKIRHKNKILKANDHALNFKSIKGTSNISIDTKKHMCKSRENIPLNIYFAIGISYHLGYNETAYFNDF
jgi:hypothetical protein